ncbi:transposase, partial [Colwellia sp. BRX8-4]|nr:transposase [Colwellia sp. BRX8-4]
AHAVMNNHLHLVLHVDSEKANNWTTLEVLSRWHKLFKGTLLTRQFQQEQSLTTLTTLTPFEMEMVEETAQVYKQRLIDISWFMRALNEPIARQA